MISDLGTATDFRREARAGPGAREGPQRLSQQAARLRPGERAVARSAHLAPQRTTPLHRCGWRPRGRRSRALAPRRGFRPGARGRRGLWRVGGGGCTAAALRFAKRGGPRTRRGDSRGPTCPSEWVAQPSAWGAAERLPPAAQGLCDALWGEETTRGAWAPAARTAEPGARSAGSGGRVARAPGFVRAGQRKQITC